MIVKLVGLAAFPSITGDICTIKNLSSLVYCDNVKALNRVKIRIHVSFFIDRYLWILINKGFQYIIKDVYQKLINKKIE